MRSKEEILQDKFSDIGTIYFKGKIFEAMDEYASEVLKDFSQQFYADEETCKHNIDEYLRLTNLDSALKNCVDISKLK